MTRRRVLVVTMDPLTEQMPGPAIRSWSLAEVLAERHDVTIASAVAADRHHDRMRVAYLGEVTLESLAEGADVIVSQGSIVRRYPFVRHLDTPLVIDLYDPYHLENLEPDGRSTPAEQVETVAHLTRVINEDLARGDFFLCASDRQRDFWLGSLGGIGRVNPTTYQDDPDLRRLLAKVPFGLSRQGPQGGGGGIFGRWPGIRPGDDVVVWGGGVYNWFDPVSLVRAIELLRESRPRIRLVFLGMRNPNPHIPEMRTVAELRAVTEELGLEGRHVFFNDGWIPYDARAGYLLDAKVAVSMHLDHVETRFAFRTRVLDYLWAGLPMVLTEGDELSRLVVDAGAGVTVAPGDVEAIARGIALMLDEPPVPKRFDGMRHRLYWDVVAAPLVEFCDHPRRAPDLVSPHEPPPRVPQLESSVRMADTAAPPAPQEERAIPQEESALSSADASYLAQIRGAMSRLGRRSDDDIGGTAPALADVEDAAIIDIDVPTNSVRREARLVKQVIKKLTRWYLRYLAQQTTVLGQATYRLGVALAERVDRMEDTTVGLVDEMARLRERIERLEARPQPAVRAPRGQPAAKAAAVTADSEPGKIEQLPLEEGAP